MSLFQCVYGFCTLCIERSNMVLKLHLGISHMLSVDRVNVIRGWQVALYVIQQTDEAIEHFKRRLTFLESAEIGLEIMHDV